MHAHVTASPRSQQRQLCPWIFSRVPTQHTPWGIKGSQPESSVAQTLLLDILARTHTAHTMGHQERPAGTSGLPPTQHTASGLPAGSPWCPMVCAVCIRARIPTQHTPWGIKGSQPERSTRSCVPAWHFHLITCLDVSALWEEQLHQNTTPLPAGRVERSAPLLQSGQRLRLRGAPPSFPAQRILVSTLWRPHPVQTSAILEHWWEGSQPPTRTPTAFATPLRGSCG